MVVTIDSTTTVIIASETQEPTCDLCVDDGSTPTCSTTGKTLTNVQSLSLEFSCSKPQDMYSVKMKKKIGEDCGFI